MSIHIPDTTPADTTNLCPNGLIRTHLVTFPRSGHHLMVRGLAEALGHRLVYSENYHCAHNMSNCEYVNLQKSHDFDDQPVDPEANYIVMIRGFELAVESWYATHEREETFQAFRQRKQDYFDRFLSKWVAPDLPNRLLITYHELVDNKLDCVRRACLHMGSEPDERKLKQWEQRERVKINLPDSNKLLHLNHESIDPNSDTGPVQL